MRQHSVAALQQERRVAFEATTPVRWDRTAIDEYVRGHVHSRFSPAALGAAAFDRPAINAREERVLR